MTRGSRRGFVSASALLLALTGCAEPASGDAGSDVTGQLNCSAIADGFLFEYQVIDFADGGAWTSCSVSDGYVEAGESSWWLAGQNGAVTAACNVTLDQSGEATAGWWAFALNGTAASATYDDPGDVNDGYVLSFLASECVYIED
jgi:hypothetical protein